MIVDEIFEECLNIILPIVDFNRAVVSSISKKSSNYRLVTLKGFSKYAF